MKFVITGALGHIGSKLIRTLPLVHPDSEIIMIDDLSVQRYVSLFHLPSEGRYRFIEGDVTKMDLDGPIRGADVVVHLAAITNAAGSFEMKEKVEFVNFAATSRVAEACARNRCRLIYLSTTSVYGTSAAVVDEDCPQFDLKPQSPYAETKLREEELVRSLGKNSGLDFIICRFGTIFGTSPGMRFHTAVNKFCWQAVMGTPITVWRTAMDQVRPYLDLQDAMRALTFITQKGIFDGKTYNVLTLNTTVAEILSVIKSQISDIQVEYVDAKIMNQLSYRVANQKFISLGFEFKGSLVRGISDTLDLLKNARTGLENSTSFPNLKAYA